MMIVSRERWRDQRVEFKAMTKARWRNGDGQDGGVAGIGGGSCGVDQVRSGKRMQVASTAACGVRGQNWQ